MSDDKTQLYLRIMESLDSRLEELFQELRDVREDMESVPEIKVKLANVQQDFIELHKLVNTVQNDLTDFKKELNEPIVIWKFLKWGLALSLAALIGIWVNDAVKIKQEKPAIVVPNQNGKNLKPKNS